MSDTTEAMRAAPCPFCGAVGLTFSQGSTHRWINAECVGCEASPGEFRTEQDCIAAWNQRAPAVTDSTHTGTATTDQLIELTAHLERKRAAAIAETVRGLPIGGHDADAPTQFHAGFALACEEIAHRLKTEAWGMLPNGGFGPTGAANEDDRPSPDFPGLLRRALAAQPSPERNDCAPVAYARQYDLARPFKRELTVLMSFDKEAEWTVPVYLAPPPPAERHYCERCGKRLDHTEGVHTCTPPADGTEETRFYVHPDSVSEGLKQGFGVPLGLVHVLESLGGESEALVHWVARRAAATKEPQQ